MGPNTTCKKLNLEVLGLNHYKMQREGKIFASRIAAASLLTPLLWGVSGSLTLPAGVQAHPDWAESQLVAIAPPAGGLWYYSSCPELCMWLSSDLTTNLHLLFLDGP